MLREIPDEKLRVLAVWEPVLTTDYEAPGTAVLARASDTRVEQFWDPGTLLSKRMQPVLKADPRPVVGKESLVTGKIVWDYVGLYPPGVRWSDPPPVPEFKGAPVVKIIGALRDQLVSRRNVPSASNR